VEGIEINAKNTDGETPLSEAAAQGHCEIVKQLLVQERTDAKIMGLFGQSTLWWLAAYADQSLVQLFIDRAGVEIIGVADEFGQTPLYRAAEHGNEAVAELLLSLSPDANINVRDTAGLTPLLIAAKNGHAAVVKLLVGHPGIDINAEDDFGHTAYSWAMRGNHGDVMLILDQAVANAGEGCDGCEQPLPLAEVGASAALPTAVGPPHLDPDDHNRNLAWSSAPQKSCSTTAPKRLGKRVARPGPVHQTDAARLCVDGNETVRLCATVGERGSTVRVSTRRRGDKVNPTGGTDANVVTYIAADAQLSTPSAKLSLSVRMKVSSSQLSITRK
jgi:hypothetical protein